MGHELQPEEIWRQFTYQYPEVTSKGIQGKIAGLREFNELESQELESVPERGEYYKHQIFAGRYMNIANELILLHAAGTGKTGTMIKIAENFRIASRMNPIDGYLRGQKTHIKGAIIITKNMVLVQKFQSDYKNKHTFGEELPSDFYLLTTHVKFYSDHKNDTDEQLIDLLSNKDISIDEVQFLIHRSAKIEVEGDVDPEDIAVAEIYTWYRRIFRLAKNSVIILATATLLNTDIGESSRIFNLLPSTANNPLPEKEAELNALREEGKLEPYLRGKISYITQSDRYVRKKYHGISIKEIEALRKLEDPKKVQSDVGIIVYPVEMSKYQAQKYSETMEGLRPEGGSDAFRNTERKASNYVNGLGRKTLNERSAKFAVALELAETTKGVVYIYCPRLASGTNELTEELSLIGYKKFDPNNYNREKQKRYGLITSKETTDRISEMLKVQQSDENIDGELIKIVVVSPAGEVGIDLYHTITIIKIEDPWTPGRSDQAEDRAFRATSHELLFLRNKSNEKIVVDVYNLVVIFSIEDAMGLLKGYLGKDSNKPFDKLSLEQQRQVKAIQYGTVDVDAYLANQDRLDKFVPLLDEYIRNSIEYPIQKHKNRKKYEKVKPIDPPPKRIEDHSYKALYNQQAIKEVIEKIRGRVDDELAIDLDTIEGSEPLTIYRAVQRSIGEHSLDRFGNEQHFQRTSHIGYLQQKGIINDYTRIIYRGLEFTHRLPIYLLLDEKLRIDPKNWEESFLLLPLPTRIRAIESVLASNELDDPRRKVIMRLYGGRSIFEFKRPKGKIDYAAMVLTSKLNVDKKTGELTGKKKQGRPPGKDTRKQICNFGERSAEVEDQIVVVHILQTLNQATQHNVVSKYTKVEDIRYLVGSKFITAEIGTAEEIVYRHLISNLISERVERYIDSLPTKRRGIFIYYFEAADLDPETKKRIYRFVDNRYSEPTAEKEDLCQEEVRLAAHKDQSRGLQGKSVKPHIIHDIATYLEIELPEEAEKIEIVLPEEAPSLYNLKGEKQKQYNKFVEKWNNQLNEVDKIRVKYLISESIPVLSPPTTNFFYESISTFLKDKDLMQNIVNQKYFHNLKGKARDTAWLKLSESYKIISPLDPIYEPILMSPYYNDPLTHFERITRLNSWVHTPKKINITDLIIKFLSNSIPPPLAL